MAYRTELLGQQRKNLDIHARRIVCQCRKLTAYRQSGGGHQFVMHLEQMNLELRPIPPRAETITNAKGTVTGHFAGHGRRVGDAINSLAVKLRHKNSVKQL